MRGIVDKPVSFVLAATFLASAFCFAATGTAPGPGARVMRAGKLHEAERWAVVEPSAVADVAEASEISTVSGENAEKTEEGVLLPVDGIAEFTLNVPYDGRYYLALEYRVETAKALKNTITLRWDGGEVTAPVPALWSDVSKKYIKDRYGNEIVPDQKMLYKMHVEYIKGVASLDRNPLPFHLKKGINRFILKNNTQPLTLGAIKLVTAQEIPAYEDYVKSVEKYPASSSKSNMVIIEAEDYSAKSDSFVRAANVQNPALYPYTSKNRLLNVIDGSSWREAGQKVTWEFEIKDAGFYAIGFRYAQTYKRGFPVFRNIEIDGHIPFKEFQSHPFDYTGLKYNNLIARDKEGKELYIWLDEGIHTIALEVDGSPVENVVRSLKEIMAEINDRGIEIKKLAGNSRDFNRRWKIEQYMPDIEEKLESWAKKLDSIYAVLQDISGQKPVFAVNIKIAADKLRDLARETEKLPLRLSKFSEGSGSAAQLIGDLLDEISEQPLSLDRIYIFNTESLPAADAGLVRNLWEMVREFLRTFLPGSRSYTAAAGTVKDGLSVWVNRPVQYVELLQQLADTDFASKSGISVKFSVMPDEQKLILANAAGTNPDAALGISVHIPYEIAIRGAAADFMQFKDFLPYISREYNLETLVPYYVDGKIYGVTETQDFFVLAYRKDIFDKLKLPVPDTWEDVKEIMPELTRFSMNFFIQMAYWSGLKPFYTTAPFIFQNGGSIYGADGLSAALNNEKTLKGLELMTELFTVYSMAENVPNFYNNFRYGLIPVGITNFGTYVSLMNAAPEISGLWDIAPSPGVEDENGNVVRYQTASERADMIFSNSAKKQEAWKFIKWWLSKDTQLKYAYSMQTKYGPEYMWNTANMAAFEELPIPENHKKVILEQWKWIKEVPRHPAGYMAEREISNVWTDVVMNGENLRIAADRAVIAVNREIERKLVEFGYIKDGRVVKEYRIPDIEEIRERVGQDKR